MGFFSKFGFGMLFNGVAGIKVLGPLAATHSGELNPYVDTSTLRGYTYNPADGRWYKYADPESGRWDEVADGQMQDSLNDLKRILDETNRIENLEPSDESFEQFLDNMESILDQLDEPGELADLADNLANAWSELWDGLLLDPFSEYFGRAFDRFADAYLNNVLPDGMRPIDRGTSTYFSDARNWVQRIDPLALDLDGDGIETRAADGTVLFDHDGDGIRTGTGWVKSDDALLVLDRNGNGTIDSGAELFGVDTVLSNGSKATDGFSALRDLDSNGDGVFDAADAQFANVRLWRDLDQDGISDAGELMSLGDAGIVNISLSVSTATKTLVGGNVQTATASFTRTDGSTGEAGDVDLSGTAANLDLASNPFYREFTDAVAITEQAAALPDMGGSGLVRDLREAASLSPRLAELLTQYSAATTRDAQWALLDELLDAWADTSGMAGLNERNPERVALSTAQTVRVHVI